MTVAGTEGIQPQATRKSMFVFHCLLTSMATKKHVSCFVGVLFNTTIVPLPLHPPPPFPNPRPPSSRVMFSPERLPSLDCAPSTPLTVVPHFK